MKKTIRILSFSLALILLCLSMTSCVGFVSSAKSKVWTTIKVNIYIRYLFYIDSKTDEEVPSDFGVENYEFEYCKADMPNPTALDVLDDLAYLEYNAANKTNYGKSKPVVPYSLTFDEDGELFSIGSAKAPDSYLTAGTYVYNEEEYNSYWLLYLNGNPWEEKMSKCVIQEGDTIVFYLYLMKAE